MASIEKRIADLEAAIGSDDKCPRCAGTLITQVNGAIFSVTKYGRPFPQAQAETFAAEERPDNRCPLCGTVRREFGIGWNRRDTAATS